MRLNSPALVVFDLDGTLIDTAPDIAYAVDAMLTELGLETAGEARIRSWIGNGVSRLVKRALTGEREAEPAAELYDRAYPLFLDLYAQNLSDRGTIYPGALSGLKALRQAGIKLGCLTNKHSRFTTPLMQATGLSEYFDYIGCGNEFEKTKPHPMPLLETAKRFQLKPSQCLMVGDSENDIEAGRAAGFQTVAVPYGYRQAERAEDLQADCLIDSIQDLMALFH